MKLPDLKFPQLKRRDRGRGGPDMRMPDFVVDLYADLRDRRLLPLVVLLLVTIVAAPILIGGGKKKHPYLPPTASGKSTDAASFSVVPVETELQEYKKRLPHRRSVNPFDPFAATKHKTPSKRELEEAELAESGAGSGASTPGTGATTGTGGTTVEPTPTTTVVEKPKVVKATLKAQIGVAAVIKAGFVGSEMKSLEIEDQTKLPRNNPAIVYDGTSKKGGALFLMTDQVSEFNGEGHCVLGGSLCQVVEVKVGQTESFAIGYGETRYKVRVLGFRPIVKEEVVEAEGKKVRVPNHHAGKSQDEVKGNGKGVGAEPSPRWLLR